jgi:predicted metal-dependent hydrolase
MPSIWKALAVAADRKQSRTIVRRTMTLHAWLRLNRTQGIRDDSPGCGDEVLDAWHRQQLRDAVPELVAKWEPLACVKAHPAFVQRMKARWGSCTPGSGYIRLNTDWPRSHPGAGIHRCARTCHLLEPTHNKRFVGLMDLYLPHWQHLRQQLNQRTARHENWAY